MRRACEIGLEPRVTALRDDDPLLTREVSARCHVKAVILAVIDYIQASPGYRRSSTRPKFPWMSEAMDLKKKNFFETRVIEYQKAVR